MYTLMMNKRKRIWFLFMGFFFLQNCVKTLSHANPSTYIQNSLDDHLHDVTSILDVRIHLPM
jgi:hypothetical protein